MKLRIASWALALSFALSLVLVSLFSMSPDAGRVRTAAGICSVVLTIGLAAQLHRLP